MIAERVAAAMDDFPGLTRLPAALFVILSDAKGRTLTHNQIEERLEDFIGYHMTRLTIAGSGAKRLRRVIEPYGYQVKCTYGIGYRLVIPSQITPSPAAGQ